MNYSLISTAITRAGGAVGVEGSGGGGGILNKGRNDLWCYAKITREGYEGRKECDSRPVLCECELLQNVRVAALVIRPANVESPSDFYFKQMYC